MPYQRRYRRRRYRRKPPTRGQIYGSAARQLYKDVNKLKNMINVEYKYHDYQSSNSLTTTPIVNAINLVNEGDTAQTHDGSMFRIKSLQIQGNCSLNTSVANPNKVRIAVVLDTDAAASTVVPTYSEIYDSTGQQINALRNLENRSRFVILKQWDFILNPNGNEGKVVKYFRKLDLKVQIIGTATEANLKKNGLYLVMLSDNTTVDTVLFDVTTRIRYIDN